MNKKESIKLIDDKINELQFKLDNLQNYDRKQMSDIINVYLPDFINVLKANKMMFQKLPNTIIKMMK